MRIYVFEESLRKTIINKKINTRPTKIHRYQRFKNVQNPDVLSVVETEAPATWAGLKLIETESVLEAPKSATVATAVLVAEDKIVCVLPSKVTVFAVPGASAPMLIPETISPETEAPSICRFPKEAISFGIFAKTFIPSICAPELLTTVIIK